MNMQVMYQDNKIGRIDSALLDSMLDAHKIKMFMRSDGWVMVGVAHMRGEGGAYEGVDRRGMYGLSGDMKYHIAY
ncbi:MAG TPA: hypothetical protein P5120_05450 [Spirochaetota bacterium]|nr:hypothetical protein [Spirochaetota bacterium]HPF05499.1 hypothetical protein [Spirochaetota bacterium]HPJ43502.1 hypothetical protein [Spirochaetota bacterium]HPR37265.1 hypothetical protein [Spirochaetota bacterium]HRX46944.1 hypothetical protein [Spirochaetota bacterium]